MSHSSPKKKNNVYLERINEYLSTFTRSIDRFDQILQELSELANSAAAHVNEIERLLRSNDDEEDEDEDEEGEDSLVNEEQQSLAGEKLSQLNDSLNTSIREIQQSWSTLEKEGAAIAKSVCQLPKLVRLFLDTTKNDSEWNDPSFRLEVNHLSEQFPIVGQFFYELCLEVQVLFLNLSSMKSIKQLASQLELLISRSASISVPLQIVRQIHMKLV